MITATAPGKALLSGEYAVLEGAPAIVAAIDRRARVTVAESHDERHSLSTRGYLEGTWHFRLSEGGALEWLEPLPGPAAFALIEKIWASFPAVRWPSLSVLIDTREFYDGTSGLKLGLGSSAAVAVALTAALQRFSSMDAQPDRLAFDAHRRFQGGRGSGADVAASIHGGVIEYRRAAAESRPLRWPVNIDYRFLWSGQPAATPGKLAELAARRGQNEDDGCMTLLRDGAENVAAAWSLGDGSQIVDALRNYVGALRRFNVDLDLGIFDAGHEQLADLAADSGIVYKPCGAGGGDIGIAVAETKSAVDAFCDRADQLGFGVLDIRVDNQGVLTKVRQDIE